MYFDEEPTTPDVEVRASYFRLHRVLVVCIYFHPFIIAVMRLSTSQKKKNKNNSNYNTNITLAQYT